jgi:hypothetical protein
MILAVSSSRADWGRRCVRARGQRVGLRRIVETGGATLQRVLWKRCGGGRIGIAVQTWGMFTLTKHTT